MAKKKQTQPTKRAIKKKTAVPEVDLPEDKEGRARVLYRLYSQEVEGESHTERLKSLMELTGLGKTTVYRFAKDGDWQTKLANELKEQEMLEHGEAMLRSSNAMDVSEHVSFEEIARDIKGFSSLAIKATKSTVMVAAKMMMYWTTRMENLVDTRGGIAFLTESDNIRLRTYEDRILYYQGLVSEFIKPSAVARYLQLVGMKESLQIMPDGNELGTLTPAALSKLLEEMNVSFNLGDLGAADAVVQEIAELGIEVPDLDGTKL